MKLIVGLGNPGIKYQHTRHNVGFITIDNFAKRNDCSNFSSSLESETSSNIFQNYKYLLCKPQTFMNLSGVAIKKLMQFYKITHKDVLVIYDEANIDIGKYKLSVTSSAGGHNGLKNIVSELSGNEFLKLKVGVKNSNKEKEIIGDFVLKNFHKEELIMVDELSKKIETIIFEFIQETTFENLMNKHNTKN